jgi:CheY-like chemotaxis protein
VPSFALVAPQARSREHELKEMGFAACLSKPLRQSSLADMVQQDGPRSEVPPIVFLPPAAQRVAAATPPAAGQRILMAEDNPINAMLTRELLKRRGYKVSEVRSGEDALKMIRREQQFDLVLMDIHMPGLDGIETTRQWRQHEAQLGRRRTPIMALTADAVESGRQACLEAGMDGFLTKPIDPAELDAMMESVFSAHERPRDAA